MDARRWWTLAASAGVILALMLAPGVALAQEADLASPLVEAAEAARDVPVASTVKLLVILTGLTFVPAMMIVMTPFTRFIIVFSLLRQALGLQQSPPNQVLIGLALLSYAVNIFLFATGRLAIGQPPILRDDVSQYTDPLPQALVLTAIVISFGMTAVIVMIALSAFLSENDDRVDMVEQAKDDA